MHRETFSSDDLVPAQPTGPVEYFGGPWDGEIREATTAYYPASRSGYYAPINVQNEQGAWRVIGMQYVPSNCHW